MQIIAFCYYLHFAHVVQLLRFYGFGEKMLQENLNNFQFAGVTPRSGWNMCPALSLVSVSGVRSSGSCSKEVKGRRAVGLVKISFSLLQGYYVMAVGIG